MYNIVEIATKDAPLISSMIFSVGPFNSSQTSNLHVVAMKLVAILVILCYFPHRNNSSYVLLLIALYLYSAGARVDAITLLNNLELSVLYNVFQKKLWDITTTTKHWIRQQAKNQQLVGT